MNNKGKSSFPSQPAGWVKDVKFELRIIDIFTMISYVISVTTLFFLVLFHPVLTIVAGVVVFAVLCGVLGYLGGKISQCYLVLLASSFIAIPIIFFITVNLPGYPFFPVFTSSRKLGLLGRLNPNYHISIHRTLEGYEFIFFEFVLLYVEIVLIIALIASVIGSFFSEVR